MGSKLCAILMMMMVIFQSMILSISGDNDNCPDSKCSQECNISMTGADGCMFCRCSMDPPINVEDDRIVDEDVREKFRIR
ncbi:unnamed protein product [Gordionus sp. m RMFG-2023]